MQQIWVWWMLNHLLALWPWTSDNNLWGLSSTTSNSSQGDQWSHIRKRHVSDQGYSPRSIIPMVQIQCQGLCLISFKLPVTFHTVAHRFCETILSPLSHLGVCATREWRWAYGRGVCTVVFIVLGLTPLWYGISLSVHWWIIESGAYTEKNETFRKWQNF